MVNVNVSPEAWKQIIGEKCPGESFARRLDIILLELNEIREEKMKVRFESP